MSTNPGTTVKISAPLARKARAIAQRRSASLAQTVNRALRRYLNDENEQEFLRLFQRSARRRGITSQQAIAKLVSNARKRHR